MTCSDEKQLFKIYEGSDTILDFTLTEKENGQESPLDLTPYDKILLIFKYSDGTIVEYEGTKDLEDISAVSFTLYSESTIGRSGSLLAEIWGVKGEEKTRFSETFEGEVLHSIKIPEGIVQE